MWLLRCVVSCQCRPSTTPRIIINSRKVAELYFTSISTIVSKEGRNIKCNWRWSSTHLSSKGVHLTRAWTLFYPLFPYTSCKLSNDFNFWWQWWNGLFAHCKFQKQTRSDLMHLNSVSYYWKISLLPVPDTYFAFIELSCKFISSVVITKQIFQLTSQYLRYLTNNHRDNTLSVNLIHLLLQNHMRN